jgi:lysozyme family protein
MADFDLAIVKTLAREGGSKYTETPGDTGGATKYGISQRAYPQLNIKTLTEADARAIYKRDYWDKIRGDDIHSQAMAESIFDFAVNAGIKTASKLSQAAACEVSGVNSAPSFIDGVIGANTVGILNTLNPEFFLAVFSLMKISRYAAICNKNREQSKFLLGWINRTLGA